MSGRGKSTKSIVLVAVARRILEEIQPATVRAVCYRLFVAGLIPSMEKKNTNAVGTQLVWAREQGLIPWEWIVDEARDVEVLPSWSDPESLIKAAIGQYRKSYWKEQPYRVEVWSEKGTVRGTLKPILDKYGVPFRVMHGFGSATVIHDVAESTGYEGDKPLVVLYVGDYDPSGLYMSEVDLPARLDRYGGCDIEIDRVALTDDQVEDTEMPSFDLADKAKDPRHRWFLENHGTRCWELDAMSPVDLREEAEGTIKVYIRDKAAWDRSIEVEAAERESLSSVLGSWSSIYEQARKCSPGPE